MDIASIGGLVLCLIFMLIGVATSGGLQTLGNFLDVPSAAITFGGAFACVFAQGSISDFIGGLKSFMLIIKTCPNNTAKTISNIIELSNVARKEGLLSLEEASSNIEDPFLKKGVLLVVDGTDPDLVRGILETELVCIEGRHKQKIGFWEAVASMGPAWGMIGTLIGLINMLQDMSDPNSIGPSMAVALITTLYGSMLANWICAPISNKLKSNNEVEMQEKEVMIEGLLSIQAGENPRVIEEKLKAFLAPKDRVSASSEGGEENG